jgi:hypothetical protein
MLGGRDLLQLCVEHVELTFDAVEVDQHLLQCEPSEWVLQALSVDPTAVLERERCLALAEDPAVTQQRLEHAVARSSPGAAQIIATAQQVTQPFRLDGWCHHVAQQSGTRQLDELLRVTAIGLDFVARADRDQRRGSVSV